MHSGNCRKRDSVLLPRKEREDDSLYAMRDPDRSSFLAVHQNTQEDGFPGSRRRNPAEADKKPDSAGSLFFPDFQDMDR